MMSLLASLALATPAAMSLDFCADQYVLRLADPEQIVGLSPDAEKDFSYMRGAAAHIQQRRPDAEQVVGAGADVVLRFWGGDAARLERLGVRVVTLDYASDFATVMANIEHAAEALGQEARGAALVAEMRSRLETLAARPGGRPRALYVTPGGVTAGAGTMIDEIMSTGGVVNIAAENGAVFWPPLPAESVVADPPSFLITGFFNASSETTSHWSAARHPAFKKVFTNAQVVHLPADQISCPAWFSLDAAEAIAFAAERTP